MRRVSLCYNIAKRTPSASSSRRGLLRRAGRRYALNAANICCNDIFFRKDSWRAMSRCSLRSFFRRLRCFATCLSTRAARSWGASTSLDWYRRADEALGSKRASPRRQCTVQTSSIGVATKTEKTLRKSSGSTWSNDDGVVASSADDVAAPSLKFSAIWNRSCKNLVSRAWSFLWTERCSTLFASAASTESAVALALSLRVWKIFSEKCSRLGVNLIAEYIEGATAATPAAPYVA